MYLFGIFLPDKKNAFLPFSYLFKWNIKFLPQNINQSETGFGDKKLLVELSMSDWKKSGLAITFIWFSLGWKFQNENNLSDKWPHITASIKRLSLQIKMIDSMELWWVPLALPLSWGRSLLHRNQSVDLQRKSMDWFLHDRGLGINFKNELIIHYNYNYIH